MMIEKLCIKLARILPHKLVVWARIRLITQGTIDILKSQGVF